MKQVILLLLALTGFLISFYFTGVYYKYLKSDIWWIPSFCRMEQQTCQTILQTPEARIFGVPNFVLGLLFYIMLILAILMSIEGFLFDIIIAISIFTVVVAAYLVYSLRVRLKTDCILCYTAHAINTIIAIILIISNYNIFRN